MGLTFPSTGAQIEKVWTNPAPAAMGQQTISMDLSAYKALLVVYQDLYNSYPVSQTALVMVDGIVHILSMVNVGNRQNYARTFWANSGTIGIGDCYGEDNYIHNDIAVPVTIYGIQF